jgi:choice-of-anchor C domain-containing protein
MHSIRSAVVTGAAALLVFTGTSSAGADPRVSRFDNGSFESPRIASNTFVTFGAGQFIGPWRINSGSADLIGLGYWQAAEGDQSLDLNGVVPGAVSQTFTTIPGTTYSVTYRLAGNPGSGPTVKTGVALIDGQNFQDFSFDITGKTRANMGYVGRQFAFVATNDTTTLAFTSTNPGAYGPVLDDVIVKPCPPCSCD